jgi:hypothetical protein
MKNYLTSADLKKLRDLYGMTDTQILALFKKYKGNKLKKKQVRKARKKSTHSAPYGGTKSEFKGISSSTSTPGLGNLANAFQTAEVLRQKYALLADNKVGGHHAPDVNKLRILTNPQNERIADHFIQTIQAEMGDSAPPGHEMRNFVDQAIQDNTLTSSYNDKFQKVSFTVPKEKAPPTKRRKAVEVDENGISIEKSKEKAPSRRRKATEVEVAQAESFGPPAQHAIGIDVPPPPPPSGLGLFSIQPHNQVEELGDEEEEAIEDKSRRRPHEDPPANFQPKTPQKSDENDDESIISRLTSMQEEFADDEDDGDDGDNSWYTKEAPERPVKMKPEAEHSTPVTGIVSRLTGLMRGGDAKIDPTSSEIPIPVSPKKSKKAKALDATKVFVDSICPL